MFGEPAMAGGMSAAASAPLFASKPRCETCSGRRSNTNIAVCLLLLGAFLFYLWYDILNRRASQDPPPIFVAVEELMQPHRAHTAPPAANPAPSTVESPPPAVTRPPARRGRTSQSTAEPPKDLEGLY